MPWGDAIRQFPFKHQKCFAPVLDPKRVFGQLYILLAQNALSPELCLFRKVLRSISNPTWPLGPEDEILGEPLLSRRLETVRQKLLAGDALHQNSREKADDCEIIDIEAEALILSMQNLRLTDGQFCATPVVRSHYQTLGSNN